MLSVLLPLATGSFGGGGGAGGSTADAGTEGLTIVDFSCFTSSLALFVVTSVLKFSAKAITETYVFR